MKFSINSRPGRTEQRVWDSQTDIKNVDKTMQQKIQYLFLENKYRNIALIRHNMNLIVYIEK